MSARLPGAGLFRPLVSSGAGLSLYPVERDGAGAAAVAGGIPASPDTLEAAQRAAGDGLAVSSAQKENAGAFLGVFWSVFVRPLVYPSSGSPKALM